MARPTKATVDYFPHYANWKQTVETIDGLYGNEGYAFFFKLWEFLAKKHQHVLDLSLPKDFNFFLSKTHITKEKLENLMSTLIDCDAIDKTLWEKYRVVYSQGFVDEIEDAYKRRKDVLPTYEKVLKRFMDAKTQKKSIFSLKN